MVFEDDLASFVINGGTTLNLLDKLHNVHMTFLQRSCCRDSRTHAKRLGTALRKDQKKKVDELRSSEGLDMIPRELEQNTLPKRQMYYSASKTANTSIDPSIYNFEHEGSHCINFVLVGCPKLIHCSDTDAASCSPSVDPRNQASSSAYMSSALPLSSLICPPS